MGIDSADLLRTWSEKAFSSGLLLPGGGAAWRLPGQHDCNNQRPRNGESSPPAGQQAMMADSSDRPDQDAPRMRGVGGAKPSSAPHPVTGRPSPWSISDAADGSPHSPLPPRSQSSLSTSRPSHRGLPSLNKRGGAARAGGGGKGPEGRQLDTDAPYCGKSDAQFRYVL